MRNAGFRIVLLAVVLFLSAGAIFAQPEGTLDTSFGTGGIVTYTHPNGGQFGDIAIQADGKIVLGITNGQQKFQLMRFNTDGTVDTSFGAGGIVETQIFTSSFGSALSDLAIQPDGKIIAVGYGARTVFIPQKPGIEYFFEFVVVRYNPNGSLDSTFRNTGIATTLITNVQATSGEKIALQADGKIVVSAFTQGGFFLIFRYNPDGSLDTTFDGDGVLMTVFDNLFPRPSDIKIQPDGKIVVSARTGGGFQERSIFVVVRVNPNGSIDTTFSGDGLAITSIDGNDAALALTLQPDGKIIAAGFSSAGYDATQSHFAMVRYNPNGTLDTTFDGDGKVVTNLGGIAMIQDVTLQPDGKIIAVGGDKVARYLPNGSLDTSFGGDGIADQGARASAVELQTDGKIVTGGQSNGGSFHITRYHAGADAFADFDGDGRTDISIFRPSNGQWWLGRSSAGVYSIAFGASTDKIVPADYTGDGKTDIAFWRPSTGNWFVIRSEDGTFFSHPFGANGDVPAPADFDGDGKADEAVFRPATATWYILRSSGGVTIQGFGANGDVPAVADYDGDGKSDIGIYRPSVGEWWIQRSSNATVYALQFGAPADKTVQGDFTGDGKADIAFWRPSTGFWFVLRSEDFSFFSFPFGANGDAPAPGDYDGDGKFDAAVFRSSTATWYVRKSTSGVLIQNFGASGDVPVPGAFVP